MTFLNQTPRSGLLVPPFIEFGVSRIQEHGTVPAARCFSVSFPCDEQPVGDNLELLSRPKCPSVSLQCDTAAVSAAATVEALRSARMPLVLPRLLVDTSHGDEPWAYWWYNQYQMSVLCGRAGAPRTVWRTLDTLQEFDAATGDRGFGAEYVIRLRFLYRHDFWEVHRCFLRVACELIGLPVPPMADVAAP